MQREMQGSTQFNERNTMILFIALQWSDFVSTLAFLSHGISEGNPLVVAVMRFSNPAMGVAIAKSLCLVLGYWLFRTERFWGLRKANYVFGFVVAWNAIANILHALA